MELRILTFVWLYLDQCMCIFQPEGEDELKKMQLMELAILNGTYRDNKFLVPMTMAAARKCCPVHWVL